MGTNLMRALLLTSASVAMVATAAPTAAYAQEATYQIDIPAQSMGDALRALGKATKQNIVFNGSLVKGKRSAAVRGRMSASDALSQLLAGSGLRMSRGSGGGLVVQAGNGAAAPASAQQRPAATQGQGRGTVTGTVKDETSGAALKGALVELVGTGHTTSTNDLGEFRFANAPAGDLTIRISYLGYIQQQSSFSVGTGETYVQDFTLTGGSGGQEIVVYGSRSARAQALNQERTAENFQTVVSADLLGHFDGATIADALRRVPGVSFQQDEVTGDGSNVIVRGLAPDFNTVTLNGLRLPEGSGTGRSPSLSNILTDSISKVTISKTLLPNQDSSGTGGLIDIETKGPLDRPRRFFSVGLEGGRTGKGFTQDVSASATIAATFGAAENFGLSASVQYRKRDIERYSYSALNGGKFPYLPLDSNGDPITSVFQIDPNLKYPFEPGVDTVYPDTVSTGYNGAENQNFALTLSGQWKIGTHTDLRFDYVRSQDKRDEYTRTTQFDPFERYLNLPVDELGGQIRGVLVTQDALLPFLSGTLLNANQNYSFQNNVKSVTQNYSFQGKTSTGPWDINYSLGYAEGASKVPLSGYATFSWRFNQLSRIVPNEFLSDEAFDRTTSDGRAVSIFAPFGGNVFPTPLLSQAGFSALGNPGEWTLNPSSGMSISTGNRGSNKRYTAKGSVKYSFDSKFLKYIEAGGFYESARFSSSMLPSDERYVVVPRDFSDLVSMADLGLGFSGASLAPVGIAGGADVVARADIEQIFGNIDDLLARNPALTRIDIPAVDPRNQRTFTTEDNFSFYIMPRIEIGKLEIVGGARFDRVKTSTRVLLNPELYDETGNYDIAFATNNSLLADGSAQQTDILPRVAATWRYSDDILVRAAYGVSVARPRIQFLSGAQSVIFYLQPLFGPSGNQPAVIISKGNPDLKSAITKNYDFSIEKYFSDAGQIKLSGFYKTIDNLLGFVVADSSSSLDGVSIPNDPRLSDLSGFFIQATQQVNGDNPAKVYGFEAAVEKQFTFLPGALSGLGFYGNYTYTKGRREQQIVQNGQNIRRWIPLTGAPKHSGTAALTFNKYGLDATLAYTMQGRRFEGYGNFGFDFYSEARSSLDFRAEYRFSPKFGQWRLWIEASDLLKGTNDADVVSTQGGVDGVPKIYTGGNYYGGRRGAVGLSINF